MLASCAGSLSRRAGVKRREKKKKKNDKTDKMARRMTAPVALVRVTCALPRGRKSRMREKSLLRYPKVNPIRFTTRREKEREGRHALRRASASSRSRQQKCSPKHGRSLGLMYVFYGLTCIVERSWRFAVPLLLGRLLSVTGGVSGNGNGMEAAYESVAVIGFWAQSFMFSSGMWIGGVIDLVPRRQLLKWVLGIQSIAVLVSCVLLLNASPGNVAVQSFRSSWLFKGLAGCCILERLSALGSDVSLERDWVVCLVGKERTKSLASANATLRRIDMACESLGPILFAMALTRFGLHRTAFWSMMFVGSLLPFQMLLLDASYKGASRSLNKEEGRRRTLEEPTAAAAAAGGGVGGDGDDDDDGSKRRRRKAKTLVKTILSARQFFVLGLRSWRLFFQQKSFLVAFSHVLLRASILYPGTMMVAYLAAVGMGETSVGFFRGSCAFASVLATCVTGFSIEKLGLIQSGQFFITFEALAGVCAAVAHVTHSPFLFPVAIVVSRLGHTGFEMVSTQIVQQSVSSSEAGAVNACEIALSSFFELLTYTLVLLFCGTPATFSTAIYYSLAILILAGLAYQVGIQRVDLSANHALVV